MTPGKRRGPHALGKLTALVVAQTKKPGHLSDGGGLYLQTSAAGVKSWVFRYRVDGRMREMGLGPLHSISLAKAREIAAARRQELYAFRRGDAELEPLALKREIKREMSQKAARPNGHGTHVGPAAEPPLMVANLGPSIEPLGLSPNEVMGFFGIGHSRLYELVKAGELTAYKEGRSTKITTASIKARRARLLAGQ